MPLALRKEVIRIKRKLNEPSVAIRIHACLLILMGAITLAMLVGPALVIYLLLGTGEDLDHSRVLDSLDIYVRQVTELSSLETNMVIYVLAVSLLVSCVYILSGALVFSRRAWVRELLICSFAVVILLFIANHLVVGSITGRYLPTLYGVAIYLVMPAAFLYRFTRADAKEFFAVNAAKPPAAG